MTSRIERGITIEGSIRGEGELEVAGRVRGALTLSGKLVVEPGGIVEADVEATDIEVAGLLAGSATAHRTVQVREGGRVEARIQAQRLMVDDGALFRGELMAKGPNPNEPMVGLAPPTDRRAMLPAPGVQPQPNEARERESRATQEKRSRDRSGHDESERSNRRARAFRGFLVPEPPSVASAADGSSASEGRGEGAMKDSSSVQRRSERASLPTMPLLPRGRTKIRVRGGES